MKTLGGKIKLLRLQKGWSQKDVAKRLEISIPAFSKIEIGITDINFSRLNQIAELFDLPTVQLLADDSDEIKDYAKEVNAITKKLRQREEEIIDLQKKVIQLYEELYQN